MDCSLPWSSVRGISQARILEWVAICFPRGSSQPRDRTHISYTGRQILSHWAVGPWNKYFIFAVRVLSEEGITFSWGQVQAAWLTSVLSGILPTKSSLPSRLFLTQVTIYQQVWRPGWVNWASGKWGRLGCWTSPARHIFQGSSQWSNDFHSFTALYGGTKGALSWKPSVTAEVDDLVEEKTWKLV